MLGEDIGVLRRRVWCFDGLIDQFGAERIRDTTNFRGRHCRCSDRFRDDRDAAHRRDSVHGLHHAVDGAIGAARRQNPFHVWRQSNVPLVLRTPAGSGTGAAAQHSESLEAWFVHVPGLKVVMPSTPYDAKGLLLAAIEDDNPVILSSTNCFIAPKAMCRRATTPSR